MKFIISLLGLATFVFSCRGDRSKDLYNFTTSVCDKNLFVEVFTISGGGAYGGDRVSDYLTDSTNFRIYIGTYDNAHRFFAYICKGDSLYVYNVEEELPKNKILSTKVFFISM